MDWDDQDSRAQNTQNRPEEHTYKLFVLAGSQKDSTVVPARRPYPNIWAFESVVIVTSFNNQNHTVSIPDQPA